VEVDLGTIAEEIEDLGKADLNTVIGLTQQILVHLIKAVSAPHALPVAHWRVEATAFSVTLRRRYVPSMRRKIDMQEIWDGAVQVAGATLEAHHGVLVRGLPKTCPFTLGDIVSTEFRFDDALAQLDGLIGR
jgi:hypothetical protein